MANSPDIPLYSSRDKTADDFREQQKKVFDSSKHYQLRGSDNKLILENLKKTEEE